MTAQKAKALKPEQDQPEPDLSALANSLSEAMMQVPQQVISRRKTHRSRLDASRAELVAERSRLFSEREMVRSDWQRFDDAMEKHIGDTEAAIALYPEPEPESSNVTKLRGAAE